MDPANNNTESRIGRVEGAIEALAADLGHVSRNVDNLANSVNEFKDAVNSRFMGFGKTNWSIVLGAVLTTLALWAAAIRPVEKEVERTRTDAADQRLLAAELAKAVLEQNKEMSALRNDQTKVSAELTGLSADVKRLDLLGPAGMATRMGGIETLVKTLETELELIREKGSPATDKRLALVEMLVDMDRRATEQRATEQRATEQRATEQRATEQRATERIKDGTRP